MAYKEEFIDVRGAKIQLLKGGSGAPLLYLHGAGGEVAWLPFFEKLSRNFTVYMPAHPGFARSEGLDRIDTIADLVFHYIDLMDTLGLERPHIAGLSLGGWLAAELAVHQAHRVAKLVLIDAVGIRVESAPPIPDIFMPPISGMRKLVFADPEGELAMTMMPDKPTPAMIELALSARAAAARVSWNPYLHDPRLRERLYRIKAPTLIVWGEKDILVSPEYGKAYLEGIKGAKMVTIRNAAHVPVYEQPDETSSVIAEFLKS
jgi:pimeloyl-ACP methyl ester carboxylesterase